MIFCLKNYIKSIVLLQLSIIFSSCGKDDGKKDTQKIPEKPNIIWLMPENIGTDLECYGTEGIQTPNINRLAQQGVKYTNAYFTASISAPSCSALLTGVHQNIIDAQHQRSNRNIPLPKEYKPITWHLRKAGYTCILGHHEVRGKGRKTDCNFKHDQLGAYDGKERFGLFDKLDTFKVADQPFFASIQLKVTHRGQHWKKIRQNSDDPVSPEDIELPSYLPRDSIVLLDMARYLDAIEYMDKEVGSILEELKNKGMANNTVVFFFGDNGRDQVRAMATLYKAGLHVPLIIRWPGKLESGKVSDRLISNTDISASTLKIAGVDVPDNMTGIPFLGLEDSQKRDFVYSADDVHDENHDRRRSIITKKYHYIRNYFIFKPYDDVNAFSLFYWPALHRLRVLNKEGKLIPCQQQILAERRPEEEMYLLKEDPYEINNLVDSAKYKSTLEKMRGYMEQWQNNHHDHGLDPVKWENIEGDLDDDVYRWVKNQRPDLYNRMQNGEMLREEARKAYKEAKPNKSKKNELKRDYELKTK